MSALKRHEGYLLIDHRYSEGVPGSALATPGSVREMATITCSHCQAIVIINPLRTRARNYCPKCNHYICDRCEGIRVASGGACKTFKQIIDETQESAALLDQQKQRGIILP